MNIFEVTQPSMASLARKLEREKANQTPGRKARYIPDPPEKKTDTKAPPAAPKAPQAVKSNNTSNIPTQYQTPYDADPRGVPAAWVDDHDTIFRMPNFMFDYKKRKQWLMDRIGNEDTPLYK